MLFSSRWCHFRCMAGTRHEGCLIFPALENTIICQKYWKYQVSSKFDSRFFSAAVLSNFRHTPSIFYICLFSFVKIFIYTFSNDFPRGMTIYAQKMNYDWWYYICGNYYNKISVLFFCKIVSVFCLDFLEALLWVDLFFKWRYV